MNKAAAHGNGVKYQVTRIWRHLSVPRL